MIKCNFDKVEVSGIETDDSDRINNPDEKHQGVHRGKAR